MEKNSNKTFESKMKRCKRKLLLAQQTKSNPFCVEEYMEQYMAAHEEASATHFSGVARRYYEEGPVVQTIAADAKMHIFINSEDGFFGNLPSSEMFAKLP